MTNSEPRRMTCDSEVVWKKLQDGLDVAYRRENMAPKDYMTLYTSVYDYCTSITLSTSRRDGEDGRAESSTPARTAGADFVGHEMYQRVEEYVKAYVIAVCEKGAELSGEDLLKYYTTEWENFRISSKVMDGIFAYLNRHWIRRELDEGHENIYMVYTLALVVWKRNLFNDLKDKVIDAMLELIRSERTGSMINSRYISGVVECLVELGVDDSETDAKKDAETKKLAVYKEFFEVKFLEATRGFYTQEAANFLSNGGNVTDYMIKVETRLNQEDDRCQLYLNSSTKTPLATCCESVLISNQLDFLQRHFGGLLVDKRDDDLSRMFKLCDRVPNGLDELRKSLENHIAKEGHQALERVAMEAATDAKLYVKTLLEVHERYQSLVNRSFKNEPGFMQSLDKAATSFINNNAVTKRAPPQAQLTKSAELLARYCDQLLRKSSKMPDEAELEELQTKIMVVFKYIDDKDVFSKFYTKMFSKRLISELSASDEAEANFITKLKSMCGYEYTARLSKMVNDTQVSKDLTADFKEKKADMLGQKSVEFNVLVLSSGSWPTFPTTPITLPQQLSKTIEIFGQFYNEKFNGRRLTWVYSQSRGEITSTAFPKKYVFTATTAQMCTMLLFNEQDSYTVEQIAAATKMDEKSAPAIVGSLIKNLVLKADTELQKEDEVPMTATVSLNKAYMNKKVRVDLSKFTMKQDAVRDTENVQKNVEEDRKSVISACIVRIMKTRKRVQHQQLMTEVITQLSGRFKPKVEMIKRCIGSLIEKEYMLRTEGQKDLYEYLA
ncbi:Cullin-1 [Caenorhabditis elegans]|uniref:Cullin-1 n=1 Tax=Caenorhabditis elegans TaxID=6239 RepID=CUL1_CAEEL|nr:Cullin-1 [Caenorhabditis elegans]Q17389.1 RecName: Full=Cullin-1; Short=CUL-1; AltName: Full=Abnormal cell lineage protein 19 [Caenorhabditis elegans]AAC47120.1 CUL-1 [Caenorhabditis elegans]CAA84695.2 Cullin-1 [Caenorhabditis elegans]|eukprot:NP_499309.1 Cullin-1 [Caenorhabditis elegans]